LQQSQAPQQQFIFPKSEPQPAVGQSVQTADGSIVTVTARGTAPMVGYVKKDVALKSDGCSINSNTWLIDPTSIYQHGSQKMYRLVNLADVNDGTTLMSGLGPSTSEVKIGSPTRKKMRVTLSTQGLINGRGQIGDDLIIDDGIAPKTVTIEQTTSPPIMDDGLLHDHNSLTVGGNSVMLSHHNVQQVHHQQHPTTSQQQQPQQSSNSHHGHVTQLMVPHGAQINVVSTRHQSSSGQRFIQQPVTVQPQMQYTVLTSQPLPPQQDEEVEFTNSIAAHLSRLNEDEKAVAKMNIQRILMDARFGIGACARMIHEEEFNEAAVGTVAHELTSAPQQHVDSSSRR
uniref:BESS domain-containing protein n=1 Tax=Syphacia muris TaxID=451379 RepID=A0A0N5AYL1_9BILA